MTDIDRIKYLRVALLLVGLFSLFGFYPLTHPQHIGHLWGDVPALFVVAAVLAFLMPRGSTPVVRRAA
jgi:hypothetical protein